MTKRKKIYFVVVTVCIMFIFSNCAPKRGIVPCPAYGKSENIVTQVPEKGEYFQNL